MSDHKPSLILPEEYNYFWQRERRMCIAQIWPKNNKGFFIKGYGRTKEEALNRAYILFSLFIGKKV